MSDGSKLDLLLQEVAVIKNKISDMNKDVHQLNKYTFIGNGQPSLLSRINMLEQNAEAAKFYRRTTIGAFIIAAIGIIANLI